MSNWAHSEVDLVEPIDAKSILQKIEYACRTCYRSEAKISEGSAEKLIRSCIAKGHESVLEHASISFKIVCDRGVSHELVRHRLASYSQESTRYCNYSKENMKDNLSFVYPAWYYDIDFNSVANFDEENIKKIVRWRLLNSACETAEQFYLQLIADGAKPEEARAILPHCLRTNVVMTMNIRALRNFIRLRLSKFAHPDIRRIAWLIYQLLAAQGLGVLFEDLVVAVQDLDIFFKDLVIADGKDSSL